MAEHDVDVVVVGAGLAGLAAASRLVARGASVCVLEARDRVGGRTLNHELQGGGVVEVGGQWIGPGQDRIAALVAELGLTTHDTHARGRHLFEDGGKVTPHKGTIPRASPVALAEVGVAQARLERLARTVPLEAPWTARRAPAWDAMTFDTWIRRAVRTRQARVLLQLGCEAVWAAHPAEVSFLHVLFYVHSGGGFERLISTQGGAQQTRIVGGSQRIALELAARLGDRVRLRTVVRSIDDDEGGVTVEGVRARRAIVALPPTLCGRIAYAPALPGLRDQLTQRMPMGSVVKCMAVYPEPFWRAEGLSGQATSTAGPVKVVFDNSPHTGSPGVLLGFLEGEQARRLGAADLATRRAAVVGTFARLFGPRAARPEAYVERSWADEEFTRGCYGGYFAPRGWTDVGRALRRPVGHVHWAGAETATRWNGYMDGALTSGERAADEVLTAEA